MQTLEQKIIQEKPPLFTRTRDFLKNKWIKYVGGAIVAGGLLLGSAKGLGGQEQIINNEQQQATQQITQDNKYKAIGYAYEGDYDKKPDLDFIFEDLERPGKDGQPLRILVHENYDESNADMLSKIILRVNNPQQYPWLEVTGKLWPASPYANMGRLDLESIIFKDQQGNEEVFFPQPSNSNFYTTNEQATMDWIYVPGREIVSVYYPVFPGIGPAWDWDGDGWLNWMDPFPCSGNVWDSLIFGWDYGYAHWGNPGWFGHNFWVYWGGPDHWRHNHDKWRPDWENIRTVIHRDQLKDPHNRQIIRNYVNMEKERRDIAHVITPDQIKQVIGERQILLNREHQLAAENPTATIRLRDGREITGSIIAPQPERAGPTSKVYPRAMRSPDYNQKDNPGDNEGKTIQQQPRPSGKSGETKGAAKPAVTKGSGTQKSPPPATNKGSTDKKGSGTVKKKHEEANSSYTLEQTVRQYEPSRQSPSSSPNYSPRTVQTYPSRVTEPRLIRPTPSQVQRYGSPSTRTPSTYSSPKNYSAPKSSGSYKPSTIRSSPGRTSGSYKAPSSTRSSGSSYRPSSSRSSGSSGSVRKK